jgi:hypothetical protein
MSRNIDDLCLKLSLKLDLKNIPEFCDFKDGEMTPRFDKNNKYFGFIPTKSCIITPRKNQNNSSYSSTNTTPNSSPILLSINLKRKLTFDENQDVLHKKPANK